LASNKTELVLVAAYVELLVLRGADFGLQKTQSKTGFNHALAGTG
jgi:hypothetical protein